MYTAFVRDQNATSENERRSAHEFSSEIRAITQTNIEIKNINPVGLGFFVEYENDESVNFIFKPEVIRNLDSKKLSASLAKSLAYKREIFALDIPSTIYNKSIDQIMAEIRSFTSNIIHVKHIHSNTTNRHYLVLTAENENLRNDLLNNNSMTLFGHNLKIERPIERNCCSYTF